MSRFGIEIATKSKTLCILACELDNEDLWDEINETEFTSRLLDGLSVEIDKNRYIYTLRNTNDLEIRFMDLESYKPLCEYIPTEYIIDRITSNEVITKIHTENDNAEFIILGNRLTIKEIKLISFKKRRSVLQFVIKTA